MKTQIIWGFHTHQKYDDEGFTIRSVPCECPWAETDNFLHLLLCLVGDRWWAWV